MECCDFRKATLEGAKGIPQSCIFPSCHQFLAPPSTCPGNFPQEILNRLAFDNTCTWIGQGEGEAPSQFLATNFPQCLTPSCSPPSHISRHSHTLYGGSKAPEVGCIAASPIKTLGL